MYQKVGNSAFKKDLTNIIKLCDYLNNPQDKHKSIHIAGTNGKGSVCSMLASTLSESGYKTGLFTSPHLLDFRERIRINGSKISKEEVISFCEKVTFSGIFLILETKIKNKMMPMRIKKKTTDKPITFVSIKYSCQTILTFPGLLLTQTAK